MNESPIFAKTYDLLKWILPLTIKLPRHQRFVLAVQIQQTAFELQTHLFEAVRLPQPAQRLAAADVDLDKLRLYLRLAYDLGYISLGQQRHGGQIIAEIGRMLGGWQKKLK